MDVLYGLHPVEEAVRSGVGVERCHLGHGDESAKPVVTLEGRMTGRTRTVDVLAKNVRQEGGTYRPVRDREVRPEWGSQTVDGAKPGVGEG